jgi:hypothetical protein
VAAKRHVVEETLWEAEVKGGALSLDTSIRLTLTNLRAIRDDQWVMLKDCDIVVANKTAQDGTTVGDIEFVKQGAPAVTLSKSTIPIAWPRWR